MERKRIEPPSGLQSGPLSLPGLKVSCRGGALCVSVREPPVEGRANRACAAALAEALGGRPGAVRLDPAARGRRKRVRLAGDAAALAGSLRTLAGSGAVE